MRDAFEEVFKTGADQVEIPFLSDPLGPCLSMLYLPKPALKSEGRFPTLPASKVGEWRQTSA